MRKKKSYIIFVSVIVLGIILDLVSKVLFANYFESGGKDITVISDFFYFTYVKNTGAAFGIFGDSTLALTIVSVVFVVVFILYDIFYHSDNLWYVLGISMLISGAIGNFIDRVFLGYVRDFISIELFSFIFNIADVLITFGVICFAVYLLFVSFKEDKKKSESVVDSTDKVSVSIEVPQEPVTEEVDEKKEEDRSKKEEPDSKEEVVD
ncbi:MAG: signal peptidase II [Clostridiales bacterium]|nr:signal peptidase II [Clostridiales bacterium]